MMHYFCSYSDVFYNSGQMGKNVSDLGCPARKIEIDLRTRLHTSTNKRLHQLFLSLTSLLTP